MAGVKDEDMSEKTAQDKKIYDLTDVYDERTGYGRRSTDKGSKQVIVIDGRGYERVRSGGRNIHDLTEVVDEHPAESQIQNMVMARVEEIIERVAREIVLEIAEKVIREEIEKIKKNKQEPTTHQDEL